MTDFVPAKRGFIAITQKTSFVYRIHTGSYHQQQTEVGLVESVSRGGDVKRVANLNNGSAKTPRDWDNVMILDPAKLANPEGFLAECRTRQSTEPGKWAPFADMNEVRALARKYAKAEFVKA